MRDDGENRGSPIRQKRTEKVEDGVGGRQAGGMEKMVGGVESVRPKKTGLEG